MAGQPVFAIAVDPTTPATLYCGTNQTVQKSVDGAGSWSPVSTGLPGFTAVNALAVDPTTPATVYAGVAGNRVYKTTTGGTSWAITGVGPTTATSIVIDPVAPAVYAAGGSVYASTTGGTTWTLAATGLTGTPNVLVLDPSTPTTLYAGTTTGSSRPRPRARVGRARAPASRRGTCARSRSIRWRPRRSSRRRAPAGVYKTTTSGGA
mgnify:CR=1 FL=1